MRIDKWKGGRLWALYDVDGSLIAVFAYKKGAEAVRARLSDAVVQSTGQTTAG